MFFLFLQNLEGKSKQWGCDPESISVSKNWLKQNNKINGASAEEDEQEEPRAPQGLMGTAVAKLTGQRLGLFKSFEEKTSQALFFMVFEWF